MLLLRKVITSFVKINILKRQNKGKMSKRNLIDRVKRKIKRNVLGEENPRLTLLNKMPKASVCAEIGVWKGEFSERIYKITEPKQLHLIDPWEFQSEFSDRMYGGSVAKNQSDMDSIYQFDELPQLS